MHSQCHCQCLREYWEQQAGKLTPLSHLWLYWKERNMEGTVNEYAEAYIRDGMKVLQNWVALQNQIGLTTLQILRKYLRQKTTDSAPFKITEYDIVTDLTALKSALAEGYPVVLGINVYESFESDQVAKTGIVPMSKRGENLLGGHAVLAVGYKDDVNSKGQGFVICRNSWEKTGAIWGIFIYRIAVLLSM